jgi:Arc/MetJ-type ribon-helix-helix transcriptional regulator
MSQDHTVTVSLSPELAAKVREKIRAGHYANENDLITDSLESFLEPDEELEAWLKAEVLPTIERIKTGKTAVVPAEQAWSRIEAHMAMRGKQASKSSGQSSSPMKLSRI